MEYRPRAMIRLMRGPGKQDGERFPRYRPCGLAPGPLALER